MHALNNSTNVHTDEQIVSAERESKPASKRLLPADSDASPAKKRPKLAAEQSTDNIDQEAQPRIYYTSNTFNILNPNSRRTRRPMELSTRSILQSFVSSCKSDLFKSVSVLDGSESHLTPPYKCAYTNAAKAEGLPLLAVATEEGSVHLFNTSARNQWDPESPRTTLIAHENNGIFDIQWSPSDEYFATASGDQSARISCTSTCSVVQRLRGHTGTVKSVAWDPKHNSLLSSGGRDGSICLWDIRSGEKTDNDNALKPVMVIAGAHQEEGKPKTVRKNAKHVSAPKSITGMIYRDHVLISSGSFDGVLRAWDFRLPSGKEKKLKSLQNPLYSSPIDPTTLHGARRPRGISSIMQGCGSTTDMVFALGIDSRIHVYESSSLIAYPNGYTHENMQTNSFYVHMAASPCGRWLATGSTGDQGNIFLYDVSNTSTAVRYGEPFSPGVQLKGSGGAGGAVDWASGMFATCSNNGTVSVWRPNMEKYRECQGNPEEQCWEWSWSVGS